jgi:succinate dehydrogenase / fumarate reductase, membrane anchor subunit
MTMQSPLGRVRGLGSAKDGTGSWLKERLSALALVPLTLWFVASILSGAAIDYGTMVDWVSSPGAMALLISFVVVVFWHVSLGLSVIVEDYVHNRAAEMAALIIIRFGCFFLAVFSVAAVVTIGLGS